MRLCYFPPYQGECSDAWIDSNVVEKANMACEAFELLGVHPRRQAIDIYWLAGPKSLPVQDQANLLLRIADKP